MSEFQHEIDLTGLTCPLPILRTKAAVAKMDSGQVLKITVTNPDSVRELQMFAKQMGHEILSHTEQGQSHVFLLKKR